MISSRAGFNALKFAYIVLLAGFAVAAFLGVGSYFYWDIEKKNTQQSERSLRDLRARLDTAKRDLNDLHGSEATYKTLVSRGVLLPEERIDLIEALATLKQRHQLDSLSYEVAPQRPLRLSAGNAYSGVNLQASRVKLTIRAAHEGHLVAFFDEFPRLQRGFFPFDRCVVKRAIASQAQQGAAELKSDVNSLIGAVKRLSTAQASGSQVRPPQDDDGDGGNASAALAAAGGASAAIKPVPALEAECSLEWITLQTKGGGAAAPVIASPTPTPGPK